ncbi:MAG: pilus assembly FimT family protein [Verrucomicrobiales bacterium]
MHSGRSGIRKGRAGFTLIELMVVLGLIAIMTGVVVSEMAGTREDALLKSSAREVIDVLNLASSRAITLGQAHRVDFIPGKHSYEVKRKVHEAGEGVGFVSLNDAAGSQGEWDERIQMDLPMPEAEEEEGETQIAEALAPQQSQYGSVQFYPDGTADPFRIIMRDRQGFEVVLKINPATGRVKVNQFDRP